MNGIAGMEPDKLSTNLLPLFDTILRIPKAKVDPTKSLQMLIANIDYDEFKGMVWCCDGGDGDCNNEFVCDNNGDVHIHSMSSNV